MPPLSRNHPGDAVTDALTLLSHDHRLIAALFAEFGQAGEQQLDPLARRICKMLRVHAQIEEDLFYPVARAALGEAAVVDEIAAQQVAIEASIILIESLTSGQPEFAQAIEALGTCLREHVESEERLLFPRIAASRVNLVALGLALVERRDTLMRMLGLADDDDIPALRQLTEQGESLARPLSVDPSRPRAVRERARQDVRRYRER